MRRLDHGILEAMRMRAVQAVLDGQHPESVAAAHGMHRKTVYGLLGVSCKGLGMSAQKPLWRAYQADPQAVEHWKRTAYPKIAKLAEKRKATIYFADEASVRSDYHRGTTWAPVGQTPVISSTGARFSVNMISAVTTANGALRFSIIDGTLTAQKFIDFCKRLLHDAGGPVFLILDGHPVHKAKSVSASPPPPAACSPCSGSRPTRRT